MTIARLDREQATVEAADADALVPVVCLRCGRTLEAVRLAAGSRADFCCACGRIELVEGQPSTGGPTGMPERAAEPEYSDRLVRRST